MRIGRKIGLSFFITFLLVILLGALSIYSLRHIYRGLNQVFENDLPATRSIYQIQISVEKVLSELNNFLITGNENFKISYKRSFDNMKRDISFLKRFISKEEERIHFDRIEDLSTKIDSIAEDIFENKKETDKLFKDIMAIEKEYGIKLDRLFEFEKNKMKGEKDLLLIQAQYIPASQLILKARSRFSNLFDNLANFVIRDKEGDEASLMLMEDLSIIEKSIRDYKNFYGYSLSNKERMLAAGLIDLSEDLKRDIAFIVDLKKQRNSHINKLFDKEEKFLEVLDKLLFLKKSGISSKLGVGAALTEDIPAIHNISKIERDIIESLGISGRYILTSNEEYKNLYRQLSQTIDRELKDYARHVHLRGTEKYLDNITESHDDILEVISSNLEAYKNKEEAISRFMAIKDKTEKKIDDLIQYHDSIIKNADNRQLVLDKNIPARWLLAEFKTGLSEASRFLVSYLSERDSHYKDLYSELYFNLKKDLNNYRNLSKSDNKIISDLELALDELNASFLSIIESHDKLLTERGWSLVKLKEELSGQLDEAVELELLQIEKNKSDIKKRIATINTVIFLIIGVVALIAIFVIFYTANSITNPIKKLYKGAEVIGRGNLDHRLDIKTGDEIQDLAEGFNRMAGELKELYTNLENKVKERTRQLAEANKALELKNKELDDFTYIVSHDLKEPLRGVKAFTKLLAEEYSDKLDAEGRGHLKTISESSSRMRRLIEDLLNLSRIGRIRNIESDVDLNDLLSDVRKNLTYSLEEKNVDLRIAENFPKVTCDRIRISEVFTNLISNAIKYSRKGVRPVY